MLGNNTKRNYGWILCGSKSFPGKYYYFNMQTRQAVWDLNDLEKPIMPQNYFHEKLHSYPEPESPPIDDESSVWYKRDCPSFSRPCKPVYGQVRDFRNHWAPKPPVYLSRRTIEPPWEKEQMLFQNPEKIPSFGRYGNEADKSFRNLFAAPMSHFESSTPVKPKWGFNKVFGQKQTRINDDLGYNIPMFVHPNYSETFVSKPPEILKKKPLIKDPAFHLYRTPSESLVSSNLFKRNKNLFKVEPRLNHSRSIENLNEPCEDYFPSMTYKNKLLSKSLESLVDEQPKFSQNHNPTFRVAPNKNQRPKVFLENRKIEFAPPPRQRKRCMSDTSVAENDLDANDLRYILLAKRRNSADENMPVEAKRIKTCYNKDNTHDTNKSKKKVTFNLDMEDGDEAEECEEYEMNDIISIRSLRELGRQMRGDKWYLVADTDVLLRNFEFIDSYVQTDNKCILLIPLAVRREIEGHCVGEMAGKQIKLAARQLTRKINSGAPHVQVQLCEEDTSPEKPVSESILQCCLQVLEEQYHVVLITDNEDLSTEAQGNGLYCFKLQEIKDGAQIEQPEISFDLKKIEKPPKIWESKFEQNIENNNYYVQSKTDCVTNNIPVNCYRKRLFDTNNDRNMENGCIFSRKSDLNTKNGLKDNHIEFKNPNLFNDCTKKANIPSFPPKSVTRPNTKGNFFEDDTNVSLTSEISRDIQRLDLKTEKRNKEMGLEKQKAIYSFLNKNPQAKTQSHTSMSKINSYTLEEYLKKFCMKHKANEENCSVRIEELICFFTQVMEDCLNEVLQARQASISTNITPPYNLLEALECIKDLFDNNATLKVIVEKFIFMLVKYIEGNGKLKPFIRPCDFMKILGCGILLIKCLKNILSSPPYLLEAEQSLMCLVAEVSSDQLPQSPTAPNPSQPDCKENRSNFVKSPSEIMMYLKRHFPEWKEFEGTYEEIVNEKAQEDKPSKVIRTTGKDIIINNNKNINLKETENKDVADDENKKAMQTLTGAKLLRHLALHPSKKKLKDVDLVQREKTNKSMTKMLKDILGKDVTNNNDMPQNDNNFENTDKNNPIKNNAANLTNTKIDTITKNDLVKTTKIIKEYADRLNKININITKMKAAISNENKNEQNNKAKIIKHYEEKHNFEFDDCKFSDDDNSNKLVVDESKFEENCAENKDIARNKDGHATEVSNNNVSLSSNNDSGIDNERTNAYGFIKKFLSHVSVTFQDVHQFLNTTVTEFRGEKVRDQQKKEINLKTVMILKYIEKIIDSLKGIISRESNESTELSTKLSRSEIEASNDKRVVKYRQVTVKCLEQAKVLLNSLKILQNMTSDHYESETYTPSPDNIQYFNIYE